MDILLLALAIVCVIVGMVGAVLPMLPGPPLSYAALWLMWWRDPSEVSSTALWITGVLMVVLLVADYLAPIWLTKKRRRLSTSRTRSHRRTHHRAFLWSLGFVARSFPRCIGGRTDGQITAAQGIEGGFAFICRLPANHRTETALWHSTRRDGGNGHLMSRFH